jgi:hypothetical protein
MSDTLSKREIDNRESKLVRIKVNSINCPRNVTDFIHTKEQQQYKRGALRTSVSLVAASSAAMYAAF